LALTKPAFGVEVLPIDPQDAETIAIRRPGLRLDNPVQAVGRQVLLSGLAKLGFTEGQNLVLEHHQSAAVLPKSAKSSRRFTR
jgi:hypothetical protein